ncbi:MAG: hypothetical protein JST55_16490 [Bacteroidetes bacterium]|nr:hypothetical protein [Bacteroidota bacterium]
MTKKIIYIIFLFSYSTIISPTFAFTQIPTKGGSSNSISQKTKTVIDTTIKKIPAEIFSTDKIKDAKIDDPIKKTEAINETEPINEPSKTAFVKKVYNVDGEKNDAGVGDCIFIEVENLPALLDAAKRNSLGIILFIDNMPVKKLYAIYPGGDINKLKFNLDRKEPGYETWYTVFRSPTSLHKNVMISVGLENGDAIPIHKDAGKFSFIVIKKWKFYTAIGFIISIILILLWLSKTKGILCENVPQFNRPVSIPYSLAYCQMAFWFCIVISFYLILFLILTDPPVLTSSVLVLIGISSVTALGATVLNQQNNIAPIENLNKLNAEAKTLEDRIKEITNIENQSPQPINMEELKKEREEKTTRFTEISIIKSQTIFPTKARESRGFIMDMLTDSDGSIAFNRFQIAVWTIVLGFIFIYNTWKDLSMPDFDPTLLGLMGISSGTYLGFKFPEAKNK